MNRQSQSYSPTVRTVIYDSLHAANGCNDVDGSRRGTTFSFAQLCIFDLIEDDPTGFNKPDAISYFQGPVSESSIVLPMFQQWAAWVASSGIRYGKTGTITPPNNTVGQPAQMFGVEKPKYLSAAMDSDGLLAIAIQRDEGTIAIKQQTLIDAIYTSLTFAGVWPVLFYTGLLYSDDETGGEIACYYLKSGKASIYVRLSSEDYATERISIFNPGIGIERLITARAKGRSMELLAIDAFGRQITLSTEPYAAVIKEAATLAISILSGSSSEQAVDAENGLDSETLAVEFLDGVIFEPLVDLSLSSDGQTLSVSLLSGEVT